MSKGGKKSSGSAGLREFRRIAEEFPFAVLESKMDLQLVYMNEYALRLLSVDNKSQLKSLSMKALIPPDQKDRFKDAIKELKKSNRLIVQTMSLQRLDGTTIDAELRLQTIGKGIARRLRVYANDVSITGSLAPSYPFNEEVLRAMIDNTHDAIALIGDEFKIEYVNEQAAVFFGGAREDLIGHDFRDFMTKEVGALMSERYTERRNGKEVPELYSLQILSKSGEPRMADLRVSLVRASDGSTKTLAHILDITDRRREQEALAETEERYRVLVETMNDGLVIDDDKGRLIYANEAFCEMLGRTQKELLHQEWVKFVKDRDPGWVEDMIEERRAGKGARYELEWVRKDGEIVPTIISATPLTGPDEIFDGTFAVVTEISAQKEAEDTIQFYLDLLTHDVANQLQVIITASGLLDVDLPRSYLVDAQNDILDAVERCNRLITKVKRAGEFRRLPTAKIELTGILDEKIDVLARVHGATVFLEDIDPPVYVRADSLLGELLWNLLENAARHNPKEKPRIWVSGSRDEGMYKLSVSDDGPGISGARKRTIFDKRKHSGGVGLTLVAQMARKYGGTIEVQDRVKGKPSHGAKFILSLHELEV
ncbi:MAG: PAS domain-containing sensor histidine kinase [Candidatus Thorarchaeota archaeon]|jgi:PAS domain S-box-containing protein